MSVHALLNLRFDSNYYEHNERDAANYTRSILEALEVKLNNECYPVYIYKYGILFLRVLYVCYRTIRTIPYTNMAPEALKSHVTTF